MSFRITESGIFRGVVQFLSILLPQGCVSNTHVATNAAIAASKLQHQHRAPYEQESATTAADEVRVVHVVKGTVGTLQTFKAGCVVANIGDSTITVDLLKNGASVLTAVITLTSAQSAYQLVEATIQTDAVAAGDVLEVSIDATVGGGTLGLGVFALLDLYEDAS